MLFLHPFIHAVEAWNTRLQLIDTSLQVMVKCNVATPVSLYYPYVSSDSMSNTASFCASCDLLVFMVIPRQTVLRGQRTWYKRSVLLLWVFQLWSMHNTHSISSYLLGISPFEKANIFSDQVILFAPGLMRPIWNVLSRCHSGWSHSNPTVTPLWSD